MLLVEAQYFLDYQMYLINLPFLICIASDLQHMHLLAVFCLFLRCESKKNFRFEKKPTAVLILIKRKKRIEIHIFVVSLFRQFRFIFVWNFSWQSMFCKKCCMHRRKRNTHIFSLTTISSCLGFFFPLLFLHVSLFYISVISCILVRVFFSRWCFAHATIMYDVHL